VRRWLRSLEDAGALVEVETHDGYRVLRAVPHASLPELGPVATSDPDAGLVERLRAWRLERSRTDGVPAYVVLHDATLVALAAARPSSLAQLADVRGFGPAKLERYGDAVLGVVGAHAHG
jgi:ATP-dependent DNA helicase RecQ